MEPEPGDLLSRMDSLQAVLPVSGRVPIAELVLELRRADLIAAYPPSGMRSGIPIEFITSSGDTRACDAIRAVEEACGWVFDIATSSFYVARATHSDDEPDAFGRPGVEQRVPLGMRPMVQVSFRFRRLGASLTSDEFSGGGDGTVFTASLPDGIKEEWSKVSERSFFEGVRDANSDNPAVVETSRKIVESGVQVQAIAARLPGGNFRLDGRLQLSSFTGKTLDRAVVDFPLQVDGPRGRWCRTLVIKGADAGARVAFRQFDIDPGASVEALELAVMVN